MHTIQLSRGSLHYRLGLKKMRDGELFLEDIDDSHSRIRVWAYLEDGTDPIEITTELNQLLIGHAAVVNTEVHEDSPAIPHGASETPTPHRIAAYDGEGRLKTAEPVGDADAVRLKDLNTLSTGMNLSFASVNNELTQIKQNHTALDTEVRDLEDKVDADIDALESLRGTMVGQDGHIPRLDAKIDTEIARLVDSSPDTLNTLNELAAALGRDANFSTTVMTLIGQKTDQSITTALNSTVQTLSFRFENYTEKTDEEIAKTKTLLQEETEDRLEGDALLQSNLNDEAAARIEADEAIDSEIDLLASEDERLEGLLETHTHDGRYYTESEVDTALGGKSNTGHTHDDRYYTESELGGQLPNTAISLPAQANLNSYTTPGFYYVPLTATAQTITNTPWGTGTSTSAVAFSLEVIKHAGFSQILRTYNTSGYEFQRQYYSGTWGTWVRMARTTDAPASHTHDDRYYTETEMDTKLNGKSNTGHTHDDRYYTESEVDAALGGKSNTGHTHDDRYYTETELIGQVPNTAISLPAQANLNSYTTPGFYYVPLTATAQTITNTPWGTGTSASAVAFSLEVVRHAGVSQILRTYDTSGYEFQRQYYDGTWGAWVRMARTTDAVTPVIRTISQMVKSRCCRLGEG